MRLVPKKPELPKSPGPKVKQAKSVEKKFEGTTR
jgi:hypothetical protein